MLSVLAGHANNVVAPLAPLRLSLHHVAGKAARLITRVSQVPQLQPVCVVEGSSDAEVIARHDRSSPLSGANTLLCCRFRQNTWNQPLSRYFCAEEKTNSVWR